HRGPEELRPVVQLGHPGRVGGSDELRDHRPTKGVDLEGEGVPVRRVHPALPGPGARPGGWRFGRGHTAASRCKRARLASIPPRYEPTRPSERITRWQGTTSGSGLVAHAVPTARTAFG